MRGQREEGRRIEERKRGKEGIRGARREKNHNK